MEEGTLLPQNFDSQAADTLASLPFLHIQKQYCTRANGSDCKRCSFCCPHGAITLRENAAPSVNHEACAGCGICAGVCDAFSATRLSLHQLHRQILRTAAAGKRVFITCEKNLEPKAKPAENVMVLPCISMMSPAFLTMILAEGVELTLGCKLETCEDCAMGGALGGMLFPRAVEIAQQRTGKEVLISAEIPTKLALLEKITENEDLTGRRQAFQDLAADFMDITSGKRRLAQSHVMQDYALRKQRNRILSGLSIPDGAQLDERAGSKNRKGALFPQQRMLATAAMAQPDCANKIVLRISQTDESACCSSLECIHLCPTGARFRVPGRKLAFDPFLCVGCGICADICPHGACSIVSATAQIFLEKEPQGASHE